MDNLESWRMFESTGKIDDYLQYAKEKKFNKARENFISKIEGERNGRDNNSGMYCDFSYTYK